MIKTLFIFSSVLLVFIGSYFFYEDEKVTIEPSVPSAVKPGDEFIVALTIHKGMLEGCASLQQFLPEGFTATPVETQQASFVFEEQHVTFTWINLPKENSFTITYKIKTDVTCNGLKTLNGTFLYIEKEKAKKIPLTPSVIMLSNDAAVAEAEPVEQPAEMVVDKLISPIAGKTGEYRVELKVRQGLKQNATRLFDEILDGHSAELIDAQGAKFSVVGRVVEFYWESLPKDPVFSVSYHIFQNISVPVEYSNTNLLTEDIHEHEVEICDPVYAFYDTPVAAEKTQTPQPEVTDVPASTKTQTPPQPVYTDIPAPQKSETKQPVHANIPAPPKTQTQEPVHPDIPAPQKIKSKQPVHAGIPAPPKTQTQEPKYPDVPAPPKTRVKQLVHAGIPARKTQARQLVYVSIPVPHYGQLLVYTNVPAPQKGIYYKVQIAASKGTPAYKPDFFMSKYHISESVDIMMHEGWQKYLIGTFEKYAAANKLRKETLAKIPEAFVVAFNNNTRIPLHEALKSNNTNQ